MRQKKCSFAMRGIVAVFAMALMLPAGAGAGSTYTVLHRFTGGDDACFVLAVSDLALIMLAATDESLAHEGMSPQRISDSSRTGSLGFWGMTGIG
jgi:hypothetical protein